MEHQARPVPGQRQPFFHNIETFFHCSIDTISIQTLGQPLHDLVGQHTRKSGSLLITSWRFRTLSCQRISDTDLNYRNCYSSRIFGPLEAICFDVLTIVRFHYYEHNYHCSRWTHILIPPSQRIPYYYYLRITFSCPLWRAVSPIFKLWPMLPFPTYPSLLLLSDEENRFQFIPTSLNSTSLAILLTVICSIIATESAIRSVQVFDRREQSLKILLLQIANSPSSCLGRKGRSKIFVSAHLKASIRWIPSSLYYHCSCQWTLCKSKISDFDFRYSSGKKGERESAILGSWLSIPGITSCHLLICLVKLSGPDQCIPVSRSVRIVKCRGRRQSVFISLLDIISYS